MFTFYLERHILLSKNGMSMVHVAYKLSEVKGTVNLQEFFLKIYPIL